MCELVELPSGINPIGSKWLFNKNITIVGQLKKFKSRLLAKIYSQVEGVNFGDIFSPIEKLNSISDLGVHLWPPTYPTSSNYSFHLGIFYIGF